MLNIFRQIRDERQDFLQNSIEVVPNYLFSQYNTVKKIHLYYNSHYEKGDYEDVNGVLKKKVFHNLSAWRCEIATKMIDLDVKDFTLISNDPNQDLNVYLLEKELKAWLKTSDMGMLLNQISEYLPKYGSCVIEKTKDGADMIDLRYLYNDQACKTLKDARYINIKYFMSHQDMRKMKGKWDNVDEAIEKFSGQYRMGYDLNGVQKSTNNLGNLFSEGAALNPVSEGAPLVEVWKRYGEVPLSWFTDNEDDSNEYVMAKYIVTGIDQYTMTDNNQAILAEDGLVLYKEQIDELPLKEVHYNKTEGRWLGIGIVESLFEPQRRINEIKNQENRAMEMGSVQVFQTKDDLVVSNVTTDMQNGQILKVRSEITPIATESRNIPAFKEIAEGIEAHSDNLTFSRDVVSGENPPASSTLGAIQIQTQQTTAVFDYKKENIGLFLTEFIEDLVFPQLEAKLNREHVLRITGSFDEMLKLRNNYATNMANQEFIDMMIKDDKAQPEQVIWDTLYEKYLTKISVFGDKIWTAVQKNFFKNLDYYVDLTITGENRNVYAQVNNANALLATIGKDPTILTDPVKKKILFKALSAMGWNLSELEDLNTTQPLLANNMQNGENQTNQVSQAQPGQFPTAVPFEGQGQAVPA